MDQRKQNRPLLSMDKQNQKPSPILEGEGADSSVNGSLKLKRLIRNKSFPPFKCNHKAIPTKHVRKAIIDKEPKPWYESIDSETVLCCTLLIIDFLYLGGLPLSFSDFINLKVISIMDAHPSNLKVDQVVIVLNVFVFLQPFIVCCIFICLEKCNKTIYTYALLNLIPIISRLLAYLAAQIHPDPLCDSLFFFACNGLILYVCFRKPLYAIIGMISVTIGIIFFCLGQGLLYEIPLVVLLVVTTWYKFSFMIDTESYYDKHHRHRDGAVMTIFIVLLIPMFWRKVTEIEEMLEPLAGKNLFSLLR